MAGIDATAEVDIRASAKRVWQALTEPDQIARYMMGASVDTDWRPGSPITWKGEYDGKPYEDRGEIIEADEPRRLVLTHFSPMGGQEDKPENYHRLTYTLDERDATTHVTLNQDNNASEDEAEHSRQMWQGMLAGLKDVAEQD